MTTATPTLLQAAIDRRQTGDNVGAPDQAAVPLGTDAEAAGTPVRAQSVEHTLRRKLEAGEEVRKPISVQSAGCGGSPRRRAIAWSAAQASAARACSAND